MLVSFRAIPNFASWQLVVVVVVYAVIRSHDRFHHTAAPLASGQIRKRQGVHGGCDLPEAAACVAIV